MRRYDAFAGVIKSGGKTRRAAKMVVLNVDHPDIDEFINCKLKEEKKAWALIEAGYDPRFTGEAYGSVASRTPTTPSASPTSSCRRSSADDQWTTHAVVDGRPMDTYRARDSSARWPTRPGSAATPASSTTPRSTTGTLPQLGPP